MEEMGSDNQSINQSVSFLISMIYNIYIYSILEFIQRTYRQERDKQVRAKREMTRRQERQRLHTQGESTKRHMDTEKR